MSSPSSKLIGVWSFLLVVLLAVCLNSPSAEGLRECGSELNELLRLVCKNGFGTRAKRFDELDYEAEPEGLENAVLGLESWPFFTGVESNSLTKTRRRRLGIVHECCDKSCSMSELMTFCLPMTGK